MNPETGHTATIAGAVISIVTATLNLLVVFGVHLSNAEKTAIIAEATAVVAIAPLIGAFIDHSRRQAVATTNAAYIAQAKT